MPTSKTPPSRSVVPSRNAPAGKPSQPAERAASSSPPLRTTPEGKEGPPAESPPERIDARIRELGDWRGEVLSRLRALFRQADPDVTEEWKWNVPVWSHDGIVCTGETYRKVVKMTFAKGASLPDPAGLFNSGLEGKVRRAIDVHEGDTIDEAALEALFRAAVSLNESSRRR